MTGKGESPTSQRRAESALRDNRALRMKAGGAKLGEIVEQLGYYDESHASTQIKKAMDRAREEPGEELLQMELERLDVLQLELSAKLTKRDHVNCPNCSEPVTSLVTKADDVNIKAARELIRVIERRSKFLGLDYSDGLADREIALREQTVRILMKAIDLALEEAQAPNAIRTEFKKALPSHLRVVNAEESEAKEV